MAVITASEWKAYRGYTGTDYDATLAVVIPLVQSEMEVYLSRSLDSATYTDQAHDGTGTGVLYLRNWPVTVLTAVKIRKGDGTTETQDSTSYSLTLGSESAGRLLIQPQGGISFGIGESPCWPIGRGNILVTYTAGYEVDTATPWPPALKLAAYRLTDVMLSERGMNLIGQSGQGMGNENVTFRSGMDRASIIRQMLGSFQRVVL